MPTNTIQCETWQAMGTSVTIEVAGSPDLVGVARQRIDQLENLWSRFLPGSDISRANATRGIPVDVHADTRLLVGQAIHACSLTGGRYDPTVHDALVEAGYGLSFEQITSTPGSPASTPDRKAAPGVDGIVVDDELGSITLSPSTGFDPGGIGKGLAADLVADELLTAGATSIFVSVGGDIRVMGDKPRLIDVWEATVSADRITQIELGDGAVATSTDQKRTWGQGPNRAHHIIDPTTGRPADTSAALVTTITAEAWWAEALATQLMLTPSTKWATAVGRDAALIVDHQGHHHELGRFEEFSR